MNVHKEVISPCTVTRIDAHFDKFEDRSEFDEALQLEDSDSIVVANTLVANTGSGRCFLNVINMADHNVKLDPNQTLEVLSVLFSQQPLQKNLSYLGLSTRFVLIPKSDP